MNSTFTRLESVFESEIYACKNMIGIADSLTASLPAVDLEDLYRHALVAAVSALDTFVHSLVREGILMQFQNAGPILEKGMPIRLDLHRKLLAGDPYVISEIALYIREVHRNWTMQRAKDIADAVKLVSDRPLWATIGNNNSEETRRLKSSLDLIVVRRNQIVHESDIDPSTGEKWPIDSTMAQQAIETIACRHKQILHHVKCEYQPMS